jgi:adenine-specific DNA-methyltransferase
MKKLTTADPETRSADLVAANLAKLKALFPELVTEGPQGASVNVDVLKQLVGDQTVTDAEEKYGLHWHGKRRARQLALTPSTGTLRPCPEESLDWDTTQNLMIEGDNLEVMKILQKSFAGKVGLIFIDPPYNTGKDFVYPDSFQDSIQNYLEITGQAEDGLRASSGAETSGRHHTAWLNMIYPRMRLARSLLTPGGVLLVSIGDEEMHNLRELCDEIFGGENFCGVFVWEKKKKPSFLDQNMGTVTDYIIAYARNRSATAPFVAGAVEDGKKYPFNNAGNSLGTLRFPPRSVRFSCGDQVIKAQDMSEGNIRTKLLDDVTIVDGVNVNEFRLEGEWRYSQGKLDEFVAAKAEIVISKVPFRPNYVNRSGELKKTSNLLSHRVNGIPTNEDATEELRSLLGAEVLSYPKPTGLLRYLIRAIAASHDIVMDFFAGSGTTGCGALLQNAEDGGVRRYILVQIPEPLDPKNADHAAAVELCDSLRRPRNLAELTKERLRRSSRRIRDEHPLLATDVGFRAFRLDSSNIREWDGERDSLSESLFDAIDNIRPGRSDADLLYELVFKFGIDPCTRMESRTIDGMMVYAVGGGVLLACLSDRIPSEAAERLACGIAEWYRTLSPAGETTCVFRDSGFSSDVVKANVSAILEQSGIARVRSL